MHKRSFSPGQLFIWTVTVIGCMFLFLFSIVAGVGIAQYGLYQYHHWGDPLGCETDASSTE